MEYIGNAEQNFNNLISTNRLPGCYQIHTEDMLNVLRTALTWPVPHGSHEILSFKVFLNSIRILV